MISMFKASREALTFFWSNLKECYTTYGKNLQKFMKNSLIDSILYIIGGIGDAFYKSIPIASQLRGAVNANISLYYTWRLSTFGASKANNTTLAKNIGKTMAKAIGFGTKSVLGLLGVDYVDEVFKTIFAVVAFGMGGSR